MVHHYGKLQATGLATFFGAFCGILLYLFASKRRAARLESYKYIPLLDEASPQPDPTLANDPSQPRKAMDHE